MHRHRAHGIAAALGVTGGAVSQWLKRAREQGVEALRRHPAPGRQPRLTAEQLAHLAERGITNTSQGLNLASQSVHGPVAGLCDTRCSLGY
jgi:transposase